MAGTLASIHLRIQVLHQKTGQFNMKILMIELHISKITCLTLIDA